MLEIDGQKGEGGGQVLRSSLAFSALTGRPFVIRRIRGGRTRPGLRPQHLAAVRLTASLCGAKVQGDRLDSATLKFEPGPIRAGLHRVDVGTAGSLTLLTQAVLLPALMCGEAVEFELTGGTDVPNSPPLDYLKEVTLPHFRSLGQIEAEVVRRGFNPIGEGCLRLKIQGDGQARPLALDRCPEWKDYRAKVVVSEGLKRARVGERIVEVLEKRIPEGCRLTYVDTSTQGAVATLWATDGQGATLGVGCLGRPRMSSEKLAGLALREFEHRVAQSAAVEEHLADQLVPLLAVAGGRMKCQTISEHCRTNLSICGLFCRKEFRIQNNVISRVCEKECGPGT